VVSLQTHSLPPLPQWVCDKFLPPKKVFNSSAVCASFPWHFLRNIALLPQFFLVVIHHVLSLVSGQIHDPIIVQFPKNAQFDPKTPLGTVKKLEIKTVTTYDTLRNLLFGLLGSLP
jgi:hypothetical protein